MEKKDYFYKVTKKALNAGTVHVKAYFEEQARAEVARALKEGKFDEHLDLNRAPAIVEVTKLQSDSSVIRKLADIEVPDEEQKYTVVFVRDGLWRPGFPVFDVRQGMNLISAMKYAANEMESLKSVFGCEFQPYRRTVEEFMDEFDIKNTNKFPTTSKQMTESITNGEVFMIFVEKKFIKE